MICVVSGAKTGFYKVQFQYGLVEYGLVEYGLNSEYQYVLCESMS